MQTLAFPKNHRPSHFLKPPLAVAFLFAQSFYLFYFLLIKFRCSSTLICKYKILYLLTISQVSVFVDTEYDIAFSNLKVICTITSGTINSYGFFFNFPLRFSITRTVYFLTDAVKSWSLLLFTNIFSSDNIFPLIITSVCITEFSRFAVIQLQANDKLENKSNPRSKMFFIVLLMYRPEIGWHF